MTPIVVEFVALTALLLWLTVKHVGWKWGLPFVLLLPVLATQVWRDTQSFAGWPTSAKPPKSSQFVYGYVREPVEIDLWLISPGQTRPRAYRLPYSRQLHQQVQQADQAVSHGRAVGFQRVPGGHPGSRSNGSSTRGGVWKAYVLPPVSPPRKGKGQ